MPLSKEGQTYEDEFRSIMQTFQDRHDESSFDPLPILTRFVFRDFCGFKKIFFRVAEILEWATTEYFSNNIDPLDSRHPLKVLPDCALGHILRFLHRSTDFFDKVGNIYFLQLNLFFLGDGHLSYAPRKTWSEYYGRSCLGIVFARLRRRLLYSNFCTF